MLVTLLGISTLSNPLQSEKAAPPMLVTLLGISTLSNPLQNWKARSPILVTLLGITVFLHPATIVLVTVSMIALQSPLLSYLVLFLSTFMLSNPLQPAKAPSPMLVALLGISTLSNPLQPKKA